MSEQKEVKQQLVVIGTVVARKPTNSGGAMVTFSTGESLVKVFFPKEKLRQIPEMLSVGKAELELSGNNFIQAV